MTCPIGLPGIIGKEPEVIAAGVVAQLLAHRPSEEPIPARKRVASAPAPEAADIKMPL